MHICKMMKQVAKTTVCLCLCLALIVGYSYKEPVTAHAAEVAIPVVDVLIQAALAALGIGIAGTVTEPIYKQILKNMQTSTVMNLAASAAVATVAGQQIYTVSSQFLNAVGNTFLDIYNNTISNEELIGLFPNGRSLVGQYTASEMLTRFNIPLVSVNGPTYFYNPSIVGTSAYVGTASFGSILFNMGGHLIKLMNNNGVWTKSIDGAVATTYLRGCATLFTTCYVIQSYFSDGSVCFTWVSPISSQGMGAFATSGDSLWSDNRTSADFGQDVFNTSSDNFYAQQASILNNPVSDVVGRVGTAVGVSNPDGSISIPLHIPVGAETDTDKARDIDQPTVLGKDIATEDDKAKDEDTNKDKDTSLPKPGDLPDLTLPQILTKKFPFSLPWDLYASVSMLAAPPTVPKYTVPFLHIAAWNINQDITIDMEKFEPVAVVCRWGFSALWIVGLIFLTKKLIWK